MNAKKLRELVSADVYLDLDHAKEHELKVYYDPGDETAMFTIDPTKFPKEEVLSAIINAKSQIKLAAKPAPKRVSTPTNPMPVIDEPKPSEEE